MENKGHPVKEGYDGDLVDGIRHGQGIYTRADGDRYIGEWKCGKVHGQGTLSHADGEKYIGESSTDYTKLPRCDKVVNKLWEYNPNVRLIYIMRHPIERTISHYWHGVRCGDEHRDILTAIQDNSEYVDIAIISFLMLF